MRTTTYASISLRSSSFLSVRIAGCLLACLLGFSAAAVADPVSFPIVLDPTIQNAWLLASHIHAGCNGCSDSGDEESYLTGVTTSSVGILSGPLIVAGGGNAGAFSDLTHGAMGIGAAGSD